ncbi:MAG: histidine phosphatase family protein [Waddliaceae bacterium]
MNHGRIILIRHGRTVWNKLRYIGWKDIPLDNCGRQQAENVKRQLLEEDIDVIYSSPLIRALDTIRPLSKERNLPVRTSDDLKELCYGNIQGMLKSENKIYVKKNHLHVPVLGGESVFDLYLRVRKFVSGLIDDLSYERHIIIVGHYLMNQMLYMLMRKIPFKTDLNQLTYKPGHGSLLELHYKMGEGNAVRIIHEHELLNKINNEDSLIKRG